MNSKRAQSEVCIFYKAIGPAKLNARIDSTDTLYFTFLSQKDLQQITQCSENRICGSSSSYQCKQMAIRSCIANITKSKGNG